jgi:hypothetical protein
MGAKIAGWIISGLVIAFYLFDAAGKFFVPIQVKEGMERSGWPIDTAFTIGAILLVCTILYIIPRTALLGAVLLTGYLGGAVATNLRLHNPLFLYTLFPVYFGILTWAGLWLREPRTRSAFPFLR